jgi:hypothetical protein
MYRILARTVVFFVAHLLFIGTTLALAAAH